MFKIKDREPEIDKAIIMNSNLSQLHESDFNLWIEEIKLKIQNQDFKGMDWSNLLDEIDDMGASQKRALDSYIQRLIEHILKLNHWNEEASRCSRGWTLEVANFRTRINRLLKKNPSLRNYLKAEYSDIYQDAVKLMKLQFAIPEDNFIELEKIMQDDYFGN